MLVSAIFLTHFTLNNVFGDLANQRIDFKGVQSNLQSNKNYRSDSKRLETNFLIKINEIKDFQDYFSPNLFTYKILKDLCQKFGKKLIPI